MSICPNSSSLSHLAAHLFIPLLVVVYFCHLLFLLFKSSRITSSALHEFVNFSSLSFIFFLFLFLFCVIPLPFLNFLHSCSHSFDIFPSLLCFLVPFLCFLSFSITFYHLTAKESLPCFLFLNLISARFPLLPQIFPPFFSFPSLLFTLTHQSFHILCYFSSPFI